MKQPPDRVGGYRDAASSRAPVTRPTSLKRVLVYATVSAACAGTAAKCLVAEQYYASATFAVAFVVFQVLLRIELKHPWRSDV